MLNNPDLYVGISFIGFIFIVVKYFKKNILDFLSHQQNLVITTIESQENQIETYQKKIAQAQNELNQIEDEFKIIHQHMHDNIDILKQDIDLQMKAHVKLTRQQETQLIKEIEDRFALYIRTQLSQKINDALINWFETHLDARKSEKMNTYLIGLLKSHSHT